MNGDGSKRLPRWAEAQHAVCPYCNISIDVTITYSNKDRNHTDLSIAGAKETGLTIRWNLVAMRFQGTLDVLHTANG